MKLSQIHMRDPFVYCDKARNKYYLFGTTLADGAGNVDPLFEVYESEDLENFSGPKPAFLPPKGFWGVRNYWAPEVYFYKGRYYMFASFKGGIGEERGTGVLVADFPEGPYIPHSPFHITLKGHECLDGTLLIEQGKPWIIYCHEWTETYYGRIEALPLSDDLKEPLSQNPVIIVDSKEIPWMRKFGDPRIGKEGYLTDGPFVRRTSSGSLVMLWSSYSKADKGYHGGYMVAMAVSGSGSVHGPWRQEGKLLLDENCGHSSIFEDLDGNLCLCVHSPDTPHGGEHPRFYRLAEKEDMFTVV